MELLAPAGNMEKLKFVYAYGADAAYIGVENFSLRTRAGAITPEDGESLREIKGQKQLYGALNMFFHQSDMLRLQERGEELASLPLDAFIVSDLGPVRFLQKHFPHRELHLSTQANCLNSDSVKLYRDLGFTRIILGREASLDDIAAIKEAVPDMELEVFVHGAMCLAYSGRCFLSKHMTGRSANQGDCAHSCRWEYAVIEEKKRPGEHYTLEQGPDFTTILSSRDLNMISHLKELKDAGVDSIKVEGRMKSLYYAAVVTRAYREALDNLHQNKKTGHYLGELSHVSHRDYSTGFFFGKDEISAPNTEEYNRSHTFVGTLIQKGAQGDWELDVRNSFYPHDTLEVLGPDLPPTPLQNFALVDGQGESLQRADRGKSNYLRTNQKLQPMSLIRRPLEP